MTAAVSGPLDGTFEGASLPHPPNLGDMLPSGFLFQCRADAFEVEGW